MAHLHVDDIFLNNKASPGTVDGGLVTRIPTVKLKIPGKLFFKVESRTSVSFKL